MILSIMGSISADVTVCIYWPDQSGWSSDTKSFLLVVDAVCVTGTPRGVDGEGGCICMCASSLQ